MTDITLLITSVGRRKHLFDALREASRNRSERFRLVAVDASWSAPGLEYADEGYVVPRADESGYVSALNAVLERESVDYVVPTNDVELLVLASHRDSLAACTTLLMPPESGVQTCADKLSTASLFSDLELRTPETVTAEEALDDGLEFPVVIKDRGHDAATRGFDLAESRGELVSLVKQYDSPIVQEYVDGREYTVDILADRQSRPLSVVPRERIALRESVSDKGVTTDNDGIVDPVTAIVDRVGARGFTNVQFIDAEDGRYWLEINPRIAGGVALGIAASRMAEQLLDLLAGREVEPALDAYQRDLYMAKYDGVQFFGEDERRARHDDLNDEGAR